MVNLPLASAGRCWVTCMFQTLLFCWRAFPHLPAQLFSDTPCAGAGARRACSAAGAGGVSGTTLPPAHRDSVTADACEELHPRDTWLTTAAGWGERGSARRATV